MFAFAIWNKSKQELFIARDRLGVKPLYYVHDADGNLFFASEIKAILDAKPVKPELNYDALTDYLANHGTCGDETLFAGIKRLPAGHTLTWKDVILLESRAKAKDRIFVVNWTDDLINFNRSFPFNPINLRGNLHLCAIVTPGSNQTAQWREEFAARAFLAWADGADVWVSNRAFSE
jgi:hypothetical protein